MPTKSVRNVWEAITSFPNLIMAVDNASRGKKHKREVAKFLSHREEGVLMVRNQLLKGTWHPAPYNTFFVFEPKKRKIDAPQFQDRVVHHAIAQVVQESIQKRFIEHTYACIVGKGTHSAGKYLEKCLYDNHNRYGDSVYVLKADISKYFESISHPILIGMLERIILDDNLMELFRRLIEDSQPKGLPLGALTSQIFANLYLDRLDHYIKEDLRVKHYVRYMDDFIVIGHDKKWLWDLLEKIRVYIWDELELTLNQRTDVFPAKNGVDFAGYRHWWNFALPRKVNMKRFKNKLEYIRMRNELNTLIEADLEWIIGCVASYSGYLEFCNSYHIREKFVKLLDCRPEKMVTTTV